MTPAPLAVDVAEEARRIASLDPARYDPFPDAGRRRLVTRVLDILRRRMSPLPREEALVGAVLALPPSALALAALLLEAASGRALLEDGLAAAWAKTAADAGELFSAPPEACAWATFEATLASLARDLAARTTAAEAIAIAPRAEYVVRRLARAAGAPTAAGKRAEPPVRRERALAVLDPLAARESAARLGRDQRFARAAAAMAADYAGGSGTMPPLSKYAEM